MQHKIFCAHNNFNYPGFSSETGAMFQMHKIYSFACATGLNPQHSHNYVMLISVLQPSLLPINVMLAKRDLNKDGMGLINLSERIN